MAGFITPAAALIGMLVRHGTYHDIKHIKEPATLPHIAPYCQFWEAESGGGYATVAAEVPAA